VIPVFVVENYSISRSSSLFRLLVTGVLLFIALNPIAKGQGVEIEWLTLAKNGAPELAIQLLGQAQSELSVGSGEWIRLENARLGILELEQHWEIILARIAQYPPSLSKKFLLSVNSLKAKALLGLDQPRSAREELRRLIWTTAPEYAQEWYPHWRLMVIQSYLNEGLLGDAATALLQHKQDFGEENHAQQILQARTMIIAGRPEAVDSTLKNQEGTEVQALRLLARFHAKRGNPSSIGDQAQHLAQQEGQSKLEQSRFWIIASKVALQAGKRLKRVIFLEHVLALEVSPPVYDPLFTIQTDELWTAYLSAGQKLVSQYWPSRDDKKLLEAALTLDEREPIKARSIYSVLALEGQLPRYRKLAHQRLTDSLLNQEEGVAIVNTLYTKSTRFKDFSGIPSIVRAKLSDYNLARGHVNLAKRLLMGMKQPPEGYKRVDWQLLLSRVAILSGRDKVAIKMLHEMLAKFKTLDNQQAERIMRVILDLQRIGEYESSIELYRVLLPLLSEPQQKRQVWYQQAEAYRMLKDLKMAACLYLQSAVFGEERINSDPWGQYTRFLAAGVLAEAGLIDDASRIYQQLLQDTEAPGRRAVILYKLQLLPLTR